MTSSCWRIAPLHFTLDPGQSPIDGSRALLSNELGSFDAVYCINESYATPVTTAAAELEVSVPDTLAISVAGEAHAAAVDPRLVHLNVDPIALGAQCAKLLIEVLSSVSTQRHPPQNVSLPMTLSIPPKF